MALLGGESIGGVVLVVDDVASVGGLLFEIADGVVDIAHGLRRAAVGLGQHTVHQIVAVAIGDAGAVGHREKIAAVVKAEGLPRAIGEIIRAGRKRIGAPGEEERVMLVLLSLIPFHNISKSTNHK